MDADITERLAGAFPLRLRARVESAVLLVPEGEPEPTAHDVGPIVLHGESLRIPSRIYFPEPTPARLSTLPEDDRRILECIYTRHHDGRVRQRYLEAILLADEAWVAPFVVQLLGEYVLEILQVLDRGRGSLKRRSILAFVAENPAFMLRTRQRVVSYWNCYHRHRFPQRHEYPGFRVLEALESVATS